MADFLVLFREPDGRETVPDPLFTHQHQKHWKAWFARYSQQGNLLGGHSLSLNGGVLRTTDGPAEPGPHQIGTELVGGYLLLRANSLDDALQIMRSCPIFEADGYAEIREIANGAS